MASAGNTTATVSVSVAAVDSSSGNSPGPVSASGSERTTASVGQRSAAVLSGGTNGVMQYLNPDYTPPASLSLDSKNSPLAMLARTCNNIGKDLVLSCGSRSAISQLHQAALHHQSGGHSVVNSNNFVVNAAPESSKAISPLGGGLLPRKPPVTSLTRPDLTPSLRHHESSTISRPAATHLTHADVISADRNSHVTSPRRSLQVDSSTSVVRQSAAFSKHSSYVNNRRTTATGTGSRQHHNVAGDVDAAHYCSNRRPSLPRPPSNNGGSKLITDRFVVSQHKNVNQHLHQTGNGNNMAADEIDVVEDDDDDRSAVPSRDDEDSNSFTTIGAETATDSFQNRYESDYQTVDAAIRRESIQRLLQSHDAIALQAAAFAAATAAAAASPYPSPQTMPSRYSAGVPAALPQYPLPGGRFPPPVAELNSPALYSAFLAAAAAAQQQYLNHVTAGRHYGVNQMAPTGSSVAGSVGISSNSSASSASSPENSCNSNRLETSAPLPAANSPFVDDVTMEDQQQNGDNDCPSSTTVVTSGGVSGDSESTVNYGQCNCALPSTVDYSNEQSDGHRHHHVSQHSIRKRYQLQGSANKTTQHYQQQLADSLGQTFESPTVDGTRAVSTLMLQTAAAAAAAAAAAGRFQPIHTGNVADLQPSLSCNWVTSSGEFCGRRFATGNDLLHHVQSHVVCNEQQHTTAHDVDHVTAAILAAGLFPSPPQPAAATVAGNVPSIHSLRMLGAAAEGHHHLSATAAAAAAVEALNQNPLAGLQSFTGAFHYNNSLLHGSNRTTAGRRSPRTVTGCGKSPPPPPSSISAAAAAASGSLLLHAAAMAAAAARYHPYKWPASAFQEASRNTHTVGSGSHSVVQPPAYLQNAAGSLPFASLYPPGLGAVVGPKC